MPNIRVMRIGHVTYGYKPTLGGAEVYLAELYRVLEEAGHSQRVYQRSTGARGEGILPIPTWRGFSPGRQFWSLAATLPARWPWLAREDLIISHYALYTLPLLWHRRILCISHCVTWDDRPGSRAARIKKAIARIAFRRCRAFVSNDTFFLREMGVDIAPRERPFQEVAPGRWFLPNCVDTEWFVPTPGREEIAALNAILVPRNFYRNRGIHLAVAALPAILAAAPESNLVIAGGSGDPGYEQEVRALVTKLGLQERVHFLGSVPWREIRAVYSAARLTIIPSLCGEATSLSALESAACGTPVVATRIGGLPDLPVELADPEPQALAAAVIDALARRDALAAAQQEAVRTGHNRALWAEAWLRVIEAVGK